MGLAAAKGGSQIAAKATSEIQRDLQSSRLKMSLENGNKISKEWAVRIDRALQEIGGAAAGDQKNRVMEAHIEVSRELRQQASDGIMRDLAIIASGQLALHYWIAAFGTLKAYAKSAGLQKTSQDMETSVEEAKHADEELTQIALEILRNQEQQAA